MSFGRHTITGLLRNQDRTQQDWTADYRFYSEDHFDEDQVFGCIRTQIEKSISSDAPLVVAMDDSLLRKTGRRIYGSRYQRDPLSPPFHINFVRGLRVLQLSAAVPQGTQGAARMIPVDFQHAALPAKPRKDAGPQLQALYQELRAKKNINLVGRERLAHLRQQMDQRVRATGGSSPPLMAALLTAPCWRRFQSGPPSSGACARTRLSISPPKTKPNVAESANMESAAPLRSSYLTIQPNHGKPWRPMLSVSAMSSASKPLLRYTRKWIRPLRHCVW